MTDNYAGLLLIGDPHLEGRQPGFRKDDYPQVILEKLRWCLDYAESQQLLPAILGDLFEKPRDNPNWLLVHLLGMLRGEILSLYGNHDVHYNPQLTEDDSLSVLVHAGRLTLLSPDACWRGAMSGREVVVGGSSYRQPIPDRFDHGRPVNGHPGPLVIWLAHHDVLIPGYEEGYLKPREIEGIDLVINGHIHRRLADVPTGRTTWLTPGNISRRSRSDACRDHRPAALRIDVTADGYQAAHIEIPHKPFEDVFHEAIVEAETEMASSAFITGLKELQARRTETGAGLMKFLSQNLNQFEPEVADEILVLAKDVTNETTQ